MGHLFRSACLLTSGDNYLAEDSEKEAAVSRAEPPPTVQPVMNALGKAASEPVQQPPAQGQDDQAILRKLKPLLPVSAK